MIVTFTVEGGEGTCTGWWRACDPTTRQVIGEVSEVIGTAQVDLPDGTILRAGAHCGGEGFLEASIATPVLLVEMGRHYAVKGLNGTQWAKITVENARSLTPEEHAALGLGSGETDRPSPPAPQDDRV